MIEYIFIFPVANVSKQKKDIPWKPIFTSVPLWALIAAQIGHDWGFFTMVTDLPKYMSDVLKYNISDSGTLSAIPYVLMWFVSIGSGWLCDWLIKRNYMGITFARKFFTTVGKLSLNYQKDMLLIILCIINFSFGRSRNLHVGCIICRL